MICLFSLSEEMTEANKFPSILFSFISYPFSQDDLTALDIAAAHGKGDSALVCEVLSKHMQGLAIATHHDPVSIYNV